MSDLQKKNVQKIFLSTLSLRRATEVLYGQNRTKSISIHALLAESDPGQSALVHGGSISIHALLAESDGIMATYSSSVLISIHALLAESDRWRFAACCPDRHFYPRSPCGERHNAQAAAARAVIISIHALLAESDPGPQPRQ